MAGKNQAPEEWTRLLREAQKEAREEALAAKTKFPKLFIVVMVMGFVLVGFLIWLKGQVDQAAAALPTEKEEIVELEEDTSPRLYAPPVDDSPSPHPHRELPSFDGGLPLPGVREVPFDPPAAPAEEIGD